MIQERSKPTFLKKLYPNTKLWISLAIILLVILVEDTALSFAILGISVALIFKEKFYFEFKVLAVALSLMAVSLFLINGTLSPEIDKASQPLFILPVLNWKFYSEGLAVALKYFKRIGPLMAALFLIFRTINMSDLGVSMFEGGLPYTWAFIFTTTFQIIPVLSNEMSQIMDAQKARGLDTEGSLVKRAKAFIPIMVPVVANSIMKVQQQAIALESKGFNSETPKNSYRVLEKTFADTILKFVSIVVAIGAVAYKLRKVFFI